MRLLTELNRYDKQVYTAVTTRQLNGFGIDTTSNLDKGEVFLCVVGDFHDEPIIRLVDKEHTQIESYADDRFRLAYKNEKKKVTKEDRDRFFRFL